MATNLEKDELDPEHINWLINKKPQEIPDNENLVLWITVDEKKNTIADESTFCSTSLLDEFIAIRKPFELISEQRMNKIRKRCNPFEKIGKSCFIDRAACKLANIDAITNFMFSNPCDENGRSLLQRNEPLQFVSIDGYPGGFVNYLIWRKGWQTKGYGITPSKYDDRKIQTDYRTFSYQVRELTKPETIEEFHNFMNEKTQENPGVHIVLADCALPIDGKRESKEIISKQLHMVSFVITLGVLRTNGHFVMKLFDTTTPFTIGLIYLIYKCFKEICIIKPPTSRPANSERYIIGKWKLPNTDEIRKHLQEINEIMCNDEAEVSELVDLEVLRQDQAFFEYIVNSNNSIIAHQIQACKKILQYQNIELFVDPRQHALAEKYSKLWQIPSFDSDLQVQRQSADEYCAQLLGDYYNASLVHKIDNVRLLTKATNIEPNESKDKFFVPLSSDISGRTLYLSKGFAKIYKFNFSRSDWQPVTNRNLMLPAKTLIYGELIENISGEQGCNSMFHIIDALVLGGVDIRSDNLMFRSSKIHQFIGSLKQNMPIKSYKKESMQDLNRFLSDLQRNNGKIKQFIFVRGKKVHYSYESNGLIFLHNQPIYEKSTTSTIGNFSDKNLLWDWKNTECLSKDDFCKYVSSATISSAPVRSAQYRPRPTRSATPRGFRR